MVRKMEQPLDLRTKSATIYTTLSGKMISIITPSLRNTHV